MRPVERGLDPGGYSRYGLAYRSLVGRIGRYCSFCEAGLKNGHVEHVLPKQPYPQFELSWDNFLLSCCNCNSTKGVWPTPAAGGRAAALWPDADNTARAFVYAPHLPPAVEPSLPAPLSALAQAVLDHTGVDRHPGHPGWSEKDDRWELRDEAWGCALQSQADLAANDTPFHRTTIAALAAGKGFWSVWRAVFAADQDMLQRIDEAFQGTAPSCFLPVTRQPVPRPGGRL